MKRWIFWLGVLISALFLYLALKDVDFARLWVETAQAKYWWLVPGVAVYFLSLWVRAWRWQSLLRPVKRIPPSRIYPVITIGYAGNNIFPARAGEVLRAVVLKSREEVPISASLATIVVERIYDGLTMLAFVFIGVTGLTQANEDLILFGDVSIRDVGIWGGAVIGGLLGVFVLVALLPRQAESVLRWFAVRLLPERIQARVLDFATPFLDGLASLRSPLDILQVSLTSIVVWLLETANAWLVMHAFDFSVDFMALLLMIGVINLATSIPSAPGYFGVFHLAAIAVLGLYNVPNEIATSYAFVLHFSLWLPVLVVGLAYLAREGISWRQVGELRQKPMPEPEMPLEGGSQE
jgi:uncharacterized protein (TIRG00374 family)